jgi:4'-phosphopantetheinyl transferase
MANLHGSDFNLSHAGERVVCAVSAQGPIGVDVEKVREVEAEDFNDVFPPDAWDRLRAAGMKKTAFFREWTRLEAVAKAEGCGMSGGLRGMESDGSVTQFAGRTWYVNEVALDEGYACHVAGVSPDPVISMQACFWDGKGLQDE